MIRLLARAVGDERGFTVVEVVVVMSVMAIASAAVLGMATSLTRNERTQQALVTNQESTRFALFDLGRDLRSATDVGVLASPVTYQTRVDAAIVTPAGAASYVRWQLSGKSLTRSVLTGLGGSVVSTKTVLTNVENASQGTTLFRYFKSSGTELTTSNAAGDFANCTIRVKVTVSSDASPGPLPFTEESDIELRNRLPGGIGC